MKKTRQILLYLAFILTAVILLALLDIAMGRNEPSHVRLVVDTAHVLEGAALVWVWLWIIDKLPWRKCDHTIEIERVERDVARMLSQLEEVKALRNPPDEPRRIEVEL